MLLQILISPFWLEDTAFPLVVNCNFFLPAYPLPRGGSQSLLSPFSFSSLRVLNGPLTLPFYPFPSQPSQHKREKPSGRKGIYSPPPFSSFSSVYFRQIPPFIPLLLLFFFFFIPLCSRPLLFCKFDMPPEGGGGRRKEKRRRARCDQQKNGKESLLLTPGLLLPFFFSPRF